MLQKTLTSSGTPCATLSMAKVSTDQTPSAKARPERSFAPRGVQSNKTAVKWNTSREAAEQPQCIQLEGSGAEHCPGLLTSLGGTHGSQLHQGTELVLPKLELLLSNRKKTTTNPPQFGSTTVGPGPPLALQSVVNKRRMLLLAHRSCL